MNPIDLLQVPEADDAVHLGLLRMADGNSEHSMFLFMACVANMIMASRTPVPDLAAVQRKLEAVWQELATNAEARHSKGYYALTWPWPVQLRPCQRASEVCELFRKPRQVRPGQAPGSVPVRRQMDRGWYTGRLVLRLSNTRLRLDPYGVVDQSTWATDLLVSLEGLQPLREVAAPAAHEPNLWTTLRERARALQRGWDAAFGA